MSRFFTFGLAALFVSAPAFAEPDLERELLAATGKAFVQLMFANQASARAECEAGKKLLTAQAPDYLAAYSEECLAIAAAPPGPGNETLKCPHFLRAVQIWRASPPPLIGDEDAALRRAGKFKEWKSFVSKHCGAPAEPERTDMGPIVSIAPGSRLLTQEGLSYAVPMGWTIKNFDSVAGHAMLRHDGRNYDLRVARVSLSNKTEYSDRTALPDDRILVWKYIEFIPGSGIYVMYGRAKLEGAYIEFGMVPNANSPSGTSVDKDFALEVLKTLAAGARIEGKRTCIGSCGPGRIIPPNR